MYIYTHMYIYTYTHACICILTCMHTIIPNNIIHIRKLDKAIPIITADQFHIFQPFPSSKLVLKTVESRFAALSYYEIGSTRM